MVDETDEYNLVDEMSKRTSGLPSLTAPELLLSPIRRDPRGLLPLGSHRKSPAIVAHIALPDSLPRTDSVVADAPGPQLNCARFVAYVVTEDIVDG